MSAVAAPVTMDTRWLDDPVESGRAAGFGLYLHVPFCAHRCGYCDFATTDRHAHLVPAYVAALRGQIAHWADRPEADRPITSVFVGGGTPTVLPAEDLAGIVALVRERFRLLDDAEITIEANPESVDGPTFVALVEAGVNRVSLGAQSFAPHVLRALDRRHDPDALPAAVAAARTAGVPEISLDLIFGTPGETAADWEHSLTAALTCAPDHLSAYALTVHDDTALGARVRRDARYAPDPDVQRDRFDVAREVLAGWDHYEVSNWARTPARRSRHNVLYWRHGDYLGLGVGAHAHLDGHRWWHHRSVERWLGAVGGGRPPVAGEETLTLDERADERLLLGLRLREGLHPSDVPPLDPTAVQDAADAGLLSLASELPVGGAAPARPGGRFRSSADGWFVLDELLRRLR